MIYLEDDEFRCGTNEPYARDLKAAGWLPRDHMYVTRDIELVLPFLEHLDPSILAALEATGVAYEESVALDTDFRVDVPDGRELMGFQRVDVEYIFKRKDTLLAEDCGTGKTPIMIGLLNTMCVKNALIICPAVAKYNWLLNEWPKWSTLTSLTIGVAEGDFWPDTDIVIINFDILPRHKKRIQAKCWDCLLVDESHRANNKYARRTIMILGGDLKIVADKKTGRPAVEIAEDYCATPGSKRSYFQIPQIEAGKRVFASGTPMNRPKNLWAVIRAFDRDGLGANEDHFHRRYCGRYKSQFGWDDNGAQHQQELGAYLRSKFMVRHDSEQVMNIPKQQRRMFLLPPVDLIQSTENQFVQDNLDALISLGNYMGKSVSNRTDPNDFMRILGEAILENVRKIGDASVEALFTQFATIREQTGLAKVPHIIDYVKLKSDDETIPLVVFGYHKSVMRKLKEAFPSWSFVVGGMTAKSRAEEVRKFQEGETPGFLGNFDAAGESITLTRANHLIAAELDWRGTQMIQVFKRIKRFTQKRESVADLLCAARSFDALMAEKCLEKIQNIELTLDL